MKMTSWMATAIIFILAATVFTVDQVQAGDVLAGIVSFAKTEAIEDFMEIIKNPDCQTGRYQKCKEEKLKDRLEKIYPDYHNLYITEYKKTMEKLERRVVPYGLIYELRRPKTTEKL